MANFQSHPGGANINGTELVVDGASVIVGLYGPKDFSGAELNVTNSGDDLVIFDAGEQGGVKLYKIVVKQSVQATKAEVVEKIYAITQSWQTWSQFTIRFRFKTAAAKTLVVRPVTSQTLGGPPNIMFRSTATAQNNVVDISTFTPGGSAPLNFVGGTSAAVKVAVFAAKIGTVERAFILMLPASGRASNLLIVISHGFGQNHAYYSGLGYSNPLSPQLIDDVLRRFVLARWGAQLMAATSDYALLMPVRAMGGGQGELGPFVSQQGVGAKTVVEIMGLTQGSFGIDKVDVVTFSSGIHECNTFVTSGGRGLNFTRGFNQDPAGAAALSSAITTRKQYLSGQTGGARPGFEFLPMPRWQNEAHFADKFNMDTFNYLHTWCVPTYTLFLGLKK